jgi:hypothetical protein
VQADRIDQQVADDREENGDQRTRDGDAGVHHPLEDLLDHIFFGDVAGQRVADLLDVLLDLASSLFWLLTMARSPLLRVPLMSATSLCSERIAAVWSSGVMAGDSA